MIKETARSILTQIKRSQVPDYLKKNQIKLDVYQLKKLESSIRENYHQGWRSEKNYSAEKYAEDLKAHLIDRLEYDRIIYIPWFNKIKQLKGSKILEIGCGTGSSTIALAEQGADVTGIDIDEDALKVARDRCEIYNIPATLISGNASEIYDSLQSQKFDIIIFFACLEHMVHVERIDCLKKYFNLLTTDGYLSILETPNRLWYFDDHTSLLPFFHWLPDHVAFEYSKFSDRINFRELYLEYSEENFLHFLRRGRGFSFHEFEIALNIPAEKLNVVDYLKHPLFPFARNKRFHKFLIQINPKISKGFYYPYINIVIKNSKN